MREVFSRLEYASRVGWEILFLPIALLAYVFHEGAHALAALPWGGPSGFYLIYRPSRPGLLRRFPIGAAVKHDVEGFAGTHVTLSPFLLLIPAQFLMYSPHLGIQMVAVVLFAAGVMGFGDLLSLLDNDLYIRLFDLDEAEFRLVLDTTRFGFGDGESPPEVIRPFAGEEVGS